MSDRMVAAKLDVTCVFSGCYFATLTLRALREGTNRRDNRITWK